MIIEATVGVAVEVVITEIVIGAINDLVVVGEDGMIIAIIMEAVGVVVLGVEVLVIIEC